MMSTDIEIKNFDLLVGGDVVAPQSQSYFDAINPSTGEICGRVADANSSDMNQAIDLASESVEQKMWSSMLVVERGIYLKKIADVVRANAKELADLESQDTGKPIKHTTFIDVPSCADCFDYFSNVSEWLNDEENNIEAPVDSRVVFEPMGVIGSITPWNYPLIFFSWKIAPALIAGNAVILKPSPVACVSIMRLAQLISEIGLPKGVLSVISSSSVESAQTLVRSHKVNMISFTGSTKVGESIGIECAKQIKKTSLELGGKSVNIVFGDCDFEAALGGTMSSIFINQGAMCTAASRLLVEESFYEEFVTALIEKTKTVHIGLADSHQTTFGPLVSREHRDNVLLMIEKAVKEGAQIACGGKIPEGENFTKGSFLEPTILTNVTPEMTIFKEENFGPVLCVMKFDNENQALTLANDSIYGLAACIWSKDLEKVSRLTFALQCGTVWVNTYGGFYNEVAFGGTKKSGFGRELGKEGLRSYTQSKHICVDKTPGGMSLASSWF